MSVSLSDLEARARLRADMLNSSFVTTTEGQRYVNEAYLELWELVANCMQDWFVTRYDFTLTGGSEALSRVALPSDFGYELFVERDPDTTRRRILKRFSRNAMPLRPIWVPVAGMTPWYRTEDAYCVIEPYEVAGGNYRMRYIPIPGDLVTGTPATGTLLFAGSSGGGDPAPYLDGQTVTISDGTLSKTFEMDVNGTGVGGGNVRVDISGIAVSGVMGTAVAAAFLAAMQGTALAITAIVDPNQSNLLDLTNNTNGVAGNVAITQAATPANNHISASGMSGGSAAGSTMDQRLVRWAEYVVLRAAIKYRDKEESDTTGLWQELGAIRERLETAAFKRANAGAPQVPPDPDYNDWQWRW